VAKADFEAAGKSVLGSKYNVQSVAARLEEGKRNLGRTSIYAPASGIVTHLTSEKGERVVGTAQMAGTEIMRISNMHSMEVQVNVNENDIVRIHRGDSADVKVDAYDGRVFRGVVTEIANSAVFNAAQNMSDQVTNFVVKIRLDQNSYRDLMAEGTFPFLPGMTASVDVKTKTKAGVIAVPIAAVTTRNPMVGGSVSKTAEAKSGVQTWVFLYNGGKAKAVEVKTGVQDLDFYEVVGGLKVGDEIVSGPSMSIAKTLNDGDKLKKKK
jgi:HlyD family secretion protein